MARLKLAPVFAVLLALTLFFGGMLSYKLLAQPGGRVASAAQGPSARSDGMHIQGKVSIRVFSPAGRLVTSWKGHNSLTAGARNGIAACVSGVAVGSHYDSCSGFIDGIILCGSVIGCAPEAVATSSMLPSGCLPATTGVCTGWESTATVNIATAGVYDNGVGDKMGNHPFFDNFNISPTLSLNPGDRAVVTIDFSVS